VFGFLENRIITHYPEAVQILNRDMPAPRTAIVYPTYICNQDCTWCEYNAENSEHHSLMKNDDFRKLIADLDTLGIKAI
jgi:MoaA/NifB/PqqE/SkfB family radical SAM enzyme